MLDVRQRKAWKPLEITNLNNFKENLCEFLSCWFSRHFCFWSVKGGFRDRQGFHRLLGVILCRMDWISAETEPWRPWSGLILSDLQIWQLLATIAPLLATIAPLWRHYWPLLRHYWPLLRHCWPLLVDTVISKGFPDCVTAPTPMSLNHGMRPPQKTKQKKRPFEVVVADSWNSIR